MERNRRKTGVRPNRRTPRIEKLESRELLSGLGGVALLHHHPLHPALVHVLQSSGGGGGGSTGSGGSSPSGGGGGGGGGSSSSGGSSGGSSSSSSSNQLQMPTAQAALLGQYHVAFNGYYVVGPPQFQNQLARTAVNARAMSWQPHHYMNLGFNFAAPQNGSSVNPVTITITGPGSDTLVLNATVEPASQGQVLPTYMTWSVNGSSSKGIFAGASGSGIAEMVYGPSRGGQRARVGAASVLLQGEVIRQNMGFQ